MKSAKSASAIISAMFFLPQAVIHLANAIALQSEPSDPSIVSQVDDALFGNQSLDVAVLPLNQTHFISTNHLNSKTTFEENSNAAEAFRSPRQGAPGFAVCDTSNKQDCQEDLLEICRQVNGIYRCLCPENISRTSRGRCTVFNECFEKSANNCSINAECLDLEEGYDCRCKIGFRDTSPDSETLPGRICIAVEPVSQLATSSSKDAVNSAITEGRLPKTDVSKLKSPPNGQSQSHFPASDHPIVGENSDAAAHRQTVKHSSLILAESETPSVSRLEETQSQPNTEETTASPDLPRVVAADAAKDTRTFDTPEFSQKELKQVFRSFDLDRNGKVAFWELQSAVDLYQLQISDKSIRSMIKVADRSGEGLVDFDEFIVVMTTR